MRRLLAIMISAIFAVTVSAGVSLSVRGKVTDADGSGLSGIMIRLFKPDKTSPSSFTRTDNAGNFTLKTDTLPVRLAFTSAKYATKEITVDNIDTPVKVEMEPHAYELKEMVVKAPDVRVKGDTVSYNVGALASPADRNIEDVIRKIPGVTIMDNGTIYYGDKPINNFYIEGMNLMGNNYSVATRNINPDEISTIDVYQHHQAKRVLKGVVDDDQAALNLKMKKGSMMRPHGHVTAGAGYGDDVLWSGRLYTMLISPKNQTIISANGNNAGNTYARLTDPAKNGSNTIFSRTPMGVPSIATNRFLNNKSAYFTANSLFKLPSETVLTFNSSYLLEHNRYDNYNITQYLAAGPEDMIYRQDGDSRLSSHQVGASFKVEKNLDKFYLKDQAGFFGAFNADRFAITGNSHWDETLRNHNYSAYNDLDLIIRRNSRIYEVKSYTLVKDLPVNTLAAHTADGGSSVLQNIKQLSVINTESTSLAYLLSSRSTIGGDINFRLDYDRILSTGLYDLAALAENHLSGYKITTAISPYYKYTIRGRFDLTLTVPVVLYDICYTDYLSSEKYKHHRPYFSPSLKVMYRPSPFIMINAGASRSYTLGDITNYAVNPIYITYRQMTALGAGTLNRARRDNVKVSFNYRNHLDGIFINAGASYGRTKHNTISASEISDDGAGIATSSVKEANNTDMGIADFLATKDVRSWKTQFSLNGSGVWSTRNSIRSGNVRKINSAFYSIGARAESSLLSDKLIISLNAAYSRTEQKISSIPDAIKLNDFSFNGQISVLPIPQLEIYAKTDIRRNQITGDLYKTNLFVDAGIRGKIRKFEIELSGLNLTDRRAYEYTLYSSLDILTYHYSLRPIQGLLTVRYSF